MKGKNVTYRSFSAMLLTALMTLGCTNDEFQSQERLQNEFNTSLTDFNNALGISDDSSADVFGNLNEDPCEYLSELVDERGELIPYGYFVGVEGELGLIIARGQVGTDLVFDLYHYQMGASYFFGGGVGSLSGSASIEFYAGVARGFERGVSDWQGWFVSTEANVGLPFLNDALEIGFATFVSGVDRDDNNFIDPTEILVPPEGVYGYQFSVALGFDILMFLPDPGDFVPIGGEITEGQWFAFTWLNRRLYDHFEGANLYLFGEELSVHLVDPNTGEECPPDWPHHHELHACVSATDDSPCDPEESDVCVDPETGVQCERDAECVIEFGEPTWDHQRRTQHMFYALCWLTGQCAIPSGYHMAQASLAAAVLRDSGMTYDEMCPNQGAQSH